MHIKKHGNCLLSVPRTEAFALPEIVEQTTLEPTPLYLNITYKPHAYIKTNYSLFWRRICSMQAETCSVVNTHLDIYRCNAPDYFLEICEVSVRLGTKRQVNAFLYVLTLFPTQSPPLGECPHHHGVFLRPGVGLSCRFSVSECI